MKLTREDYAALERSGITPEMAKAAGLYRVASLDGRVLVGRNGSGDYAGVVFPYRWPGSQDVFLERLRLDHPPVDAATGKPAHKYLSPPAARNRLYFAPCDPALIADVNVPAVITEGEKKCLALWRVSLESGNGKPAFLPIAISGVWGWRSTVGIVTDAKGERVPEKGVLPDFDRIPWTGRTVKILFDANAATNTSVQAARLGLARELTRREAEVWIAELPAVPGVNGVDDFFAHCGLEETLKVLSTTTRYEWRKELLITGTSGAVKGNLANAITALRSAPEWIGVLSFDEFTRCVTATRKPPFGAVDNKWTEQQDRLTADWMQHQGIAVGDVEAGKAVETVARERLCHPVREYLDLLKWDGIARINSWLTLYLGVQSSNLTRAFASKWLISAVARIYEPGCKADHCLILEGAQGTLKSTALRTLAGQWFTDDIANLDNQKEAAIGTTGVWIIELSELDAMNKAEKSRVKSFLSRQTDRYRPPYGRRYVDMPRQCIFAGTVNHDTYLEDETGGRRFWPVECGRIDIQSLERDRDQLWAEAVARYRKNEIWWLEPELIKLASEAQQQRMREDSWEPVIEPWLEKRIADPNVVPDCTIADVLTGALNKAIGLCTKSDETRVGVCLRKFGWRPYRPWTGGDSGERRRMYRPLVPP